MKYKIHAINPHKEFHEVLCVRDYQGFKQGHIYAQIGWNNGSQVINCDGSGDPYALICLNSWDNGEDELVVYDDQSCREITVFRYLKRETNKKED